MKQTIYSILTIIAFIGTVIAVVFSGMGKLIISGMCWNAVAVLLWLRSSIIGNKINWDKE